MRSPNFWSSFQFAMRGLWETIQSQRNARIHCVAALGVTVLAGILRLDPLRFAMVLFAIGMVVAAEVFNTAIESLVDLVSPEHHELARRAKDAAAGAVLVAALTAVAVAGVIFVPLLLTWWQQG